MADQSHELEGTGQSSYPGDFNSDEIESVRGTEVSLRARGFNPYKEDYYKMLNLANAQKSGSPVTEIFVGDVERPKSPTSVGIRQKLGKLGVK